MEEAVLELIKVWAVDFAWNLTIIVLVILNCWLWTQLGKW